jgi:hypothetical protein
MTADQVHAAVHALEASGQPATADRIIRLIGGSKRDVTALLRQIRHGPNHAVLVASASVHTPVDRVVFPVAQQPDPTREHDALGHPDQVVQESDSWNETKESPWHVAAAALTQATAAEHALGTQMTAARATVRQGDALLRRLQLQQTQTRSAAWYAELVAQEQALTPQVVLAREDCRALQTQRAQAVQTMMQTHEEARRIAEQAQTRLRTVVKASLPLDEETVREAAERRRTLAQAWTELQALVGADEAERARRGDVRPWMQMR